MAENEKSDNCIVDFAIQLFIMLQYRKNQKACVLLFIFSFCLRQKGNHLNVHKLFPYPETPVHCQINLLCKQDEFKHKVYHFKTSKTAIYSTEWFLHNFH